MSPAEEATLDAVGGTVDVGGDPGAPTLDIGMRAVVAASAASDVLLRTAAASALVAASLPWALRPGSVRADRKLLEFYPSLAGREDVFEPPPAGIPVSAKPERDRSLNAPGGRIELLRFQSPYVALNPKLRDRYSSYRQNALAGAQHWRHDDGPRPTLFVMHGYGASPFWLNSAFFSLPWFYRHGYDVMLFVMPFHGPRQEAHSPFNGSGLVAHGMAHFNEVIAQAVCDIRVLLDYLKRAEVPSVAMTGLSLGGYMTSLMATLEPGLAAVIPNAPVTDFSAIARNWFPASLSLGAVLMAAGIPAAELETAIAFHSPLQRSPVVAKERRMIIGGLGERLAPPSHARALWEHWDQPRLHWYPGNHALHVRRGAYLKEMRRFMSDNGVEYGK
jgi:pimeloyl-ACP methyl ester carboxylesterase